MYIQNADWTLNQTFNLKIPETGEETFFHGPVMAYDSNNKLHEICYDDDEQENYY